MRSIIASVLMISACTQSETETAPQLVETEVNQQVSSNDVSLLNAASLFENFCNGTEVTLNTVSQTASSKGLPELDPYEFKPIIWGVVRSETRAWLIDSDDTRHVLLVEQGGLPTQEEREAVRIGQIVTGNPVGKGAIDPFQPGLMGLFSCSIYGTAEIDSLTRQRVESLLTWLPTDVELKIGEPAGIGRLAGVYAKQMTWVHSELSADSITFEHYRKAPEETLFPNYKLSAHRRILDPSHE